MPSGRVRVSWFDLVVEYWPRQWKEGYKDKIKIAIDGSISDSHVCNGRCMTASEYVSVEQARAFAYEILAITDPHLTTPFGYVRE